MSIDLHSVRQEVETLRAQRARENEDLTIQRFTRLLVEAKKEGARSTVVALRGERAAALVIDHHLTPGAP